jgi:hypothetical protein
MTKFFREPPEWGWFIGILAMSIKEVVRGHYLGLLTGVPFLLVAIIAPKQFQLPLWLMFSIGALVNFTIAVTGRIDYFSAAVYLLLIVYGADESYKLIANKEDAGT